MNFHVDQPGVTYITLQLNRRDLVSNEVSWQVKGVSTSAIERDIQRAEEHVAPINDRRGSKDMTEILVPGLLRSVMRPNVAGPFDDRVFPLGQVDDIVIDLRRFRFIPPGQRNVTIFELPQPQDLIQCRIKRFSETISFPIRE